MHAYRDSIENRLLPEKRVRPPLAAERKATSGAAKTASRLVKPVRLPDTQLSAGKGKGKAKAKKGIPLTYSEKLAAPKPAPGQWVLVGKGGKHTKAKKSKASKPKVAERKDS